MKGGGSVGNDVTGKGVCVGVGEGAEDYCVSSGERNK